MMRFLQKLALGACLLILVTGTLSGHSMAAPSVQNGKAWEKKRKPSLIS